MLAFALQGFIKVALAVDYLVIEPLVDEIPLIEIGRVGSVTQTMSATGVRVIAPNMPGRLWEPSVIAVARFYGCGAGVGLRADGEIARDDVKHDAEEREDGWE